MENITHILGLISRVPFYIIRSIIPRATRDDTRSKLMQIWVEVILYCDRSFPEKKGKYKSNLEQASFVTFAKIIMNFFPCFHSTVPKNHLATRQCSFSKGKHCYIGDEIISVFTLRATLVRRNTSLRAQAINRIGP